MTESILSNIYFEPIISIYIIIILIIIFVLSSFYALIKKVEGSFLRLLIFIMLIVLVAQPIIKIENRELEKDIITIFLDKTQSQKITNRTNSVDEIRKILLSKISTIENVDILEISVNEGVVETKFGDINKIITNQVDINTEERDKKEIISSNLINILKTKINKYPPKKISTIFIITDGQIHDLSAHSFQDKLDIPIYYILSGDKKLNDIKLTLLSTPSFNYLDEKIKVKFKIDDFLYNQEFAELKVNNSFMSEIKKKFKIGIDNEIEFTLPKIGQNIFKFSVDKRENEISEINNSEIVKIDGIRKKLRVLLISGEPYMGTRVWRNFLKSDPSVELIHMTVLRPPEKNDDTPFDELSLIPFPIKELFEKKLDKFHLIIFDNFKGRNVISPLYLQNLKKFINNGGALLEIAGPAYNSKFSLFKTEIGSILPGVPSGEIMRKEFKPKLTEIGEKHPITSSMFDTYKSYGSWFEMNKILNLDSEAITLLSGINDFPLLSIKKQMKGRIAQIYSDQIWLWYKAYEEKDGGPYNKLIKNLAHWLMKEPLLEENQLFLDVKNNKILIEKKFIVIPNKKEILVTVKNPDDSKRELKLKKVSNSRYAVEYEFNESGEYLISDGIIEKSIKTQEFENYELQNLNITSEIINNNNISKIFSKVISIEDLESQRFKEKSIVEKNNKKAKNIYIKRNKNFVTKGFNNHKIFNPSFLIILILLAIMFCWRRESKK